MCHCRKRLEFRSIAGISKIRQRWQDESTEKHGKNAENEKSVHEIKHKAQTALYYKEGYFIICVRSIAAASEIDWVV